jgi:hypothetical protein
MDSSNTLYSNFITYTNHINAYFYKDQDYYFVITSYDNKKISENERKSMPVLINFVPKDFVEYEFEVVEATSSFLYLRNFSNDYLVSLSKIPNQEIDSSSSSNETDEFAYENNKLENEYEYNQNQSDYESYYSDNSEDGYDSEGFYFRQRYY